MRRMLKILESGRDRGSSEPNNFENQMKILSDLRARFVVPGALPDRIRFDSDWMAKASNVRRRHRDPFGACRFRAARGHRSIKSERGDLERTSPTRTALAEASPSVVMPRSAADRMRFGLRGFRSLVVRPQPPPRFVTALRVPPVRRRIARRLLPSSIRPPPPAKLSRHRTAAARPPETSLCQETHRTGASGGGRTRARGRTEARRRPERRAPSEGGGLRRRRRSPKRNRRRRTRTRGCRERPPRTAGNTERPPPCPRRTPAGCRRR
mmetsp:Transcript_2034/g.5372  ORF Transcript_2034/g.5372 Transcript_2034/m.5372 type:complete len:267 (-) Transcript_2034:1315-2115(-)